MKNNRNVIMFHSVGSNHSQWKSRYLSIDVEQFEVFCEYLRSKNYKTGFLDRWYYLEDHPEEKTGKELFLTFDDGYLDNLLVAYPIMKKYDIKGTIFVNPEFVDPSEGIRTLNNHPSTLGFLNWDEICWLDKSGVFDIQSHSMSHNFYFCTDKVKGIHKGDDEYHWLAWISKPERKSFWQEEDQGGFTPLGTPVFEWYRALGLRRYFPDDRLVKLSIEEYTKNGDEKQLMSKITEWQKEYPGRYETDEEMTQRYHYELYDSKRILEEKLEKKIDFLCWPGGGYNELSLKMAINAGYKASTIASREGKKIVNNKNVAYKRIVRMGMDSTIRKGGYLRPQRVVQTNFKHHLVWLFKTEERHPVYRFFTRANNFIMRFL